MTLEELKAKYSRLPKEIKEMNRWVCYRKSDKAPMNALTGKFASSTNKLTWTSFNCAVMGCIKFNFDGIGFMLGDGIFGVDLDNHEDKVTGKKPYNANEFEKLIDEFVVGLNSYAERSQSGEGVHIICKGKLPENANNRRNGVGVEMYDSGRYFATTGDVVNDMAIEDRTNEIVPLWEKYLKVDAPIITPRERYVAETINNADGSVTFGETMVLTTERQPLNLSDSEIIEKIRNSKNAYEFISLYNGDMTKYNNDHSAADLALCTILAFWTGNDPIQMDRIFRSSALYRDKWDQQRGRDTYGNLTIEKAISGTTESYTPPREKSVVKINTVKATKIVTQNNECVMNIDENGDPIIREKTIFKTYSLDDTGNAERFYDYFGDLFRYNQTNKNFMFWTGKTWVADNQGYVKKYADVIVNILKDEAFSLTKEIEDAFKNGDKDASDELRGKQQAMLKNAARVANKAGKEAMISELQHLHNIPVCSEDFDLDDELLNTDSGIVNLRTGDLMPFDKDKMLSKNTRCKVSYEEPTVWLKFLESVFRRENPKKTDEENKQDTIELIECLQKCMGYSLSGSTAEQVMFLLYGNGSNGKSTFSEQVARVLGDYAGTTPNSTLMQSKMGSNNGQLFSIAKLNGLRYVSTGETDEGGKLAESTVKLLTGSDKISAQFKFGNEFDFIPKFKIWMATNNKPIIRGTDLGIWRRLFFFPFERTFTGKDKDKDLPKKLAAESDKILGWAIQGYQKYINDGNGLVKPRCVEEALSDYKKEMDVVSTYLSRQCSDFAFFLTKATDLYRDYKDWAKDNTEYLMPETKFGTELLKKGYQKKRMSDGWYYVGIELNTDRRGVTFRDE